MQKRRLGKNGREVSCLGYGAMSFTNFYGEANDDDSLAILAAALDEGVDHLDTSNVYGMGRSETVIGKFLSKQGKQKDKLFSIASKVGICRNAETGQRFYDNSESHIRSELEKTLQRLGVENIDLYYIHRRQAEIPIEEVTETMQTLIKEGKINSFGFSEISPSSLERANRIAHVAAVQSEYSLSVRSPEMGLTQMTKELGTALVAFSPVGRSLLTDAPHNFETAKELEFLKINPRFLEPNLSTNIEKVAGFQKLAADLGLTAAGLAIAWLLHKDEHIIPIPGTRSIQHFKDNCAGARKSLSANDMAMIEKTLPIGWAHGDRYSSEQWFGVERYC